jgi:hypothetical protein
MTQAVETTLKYPMQRVARRTKKGLAAASTTLACVSCKKRWRQLQALTMADCNKHIGQTKIN